VRYLDQFYALYYDLESAQFLFNRAAALVGDPAARRLMCALRDHDLELITVVQREIATVEYKTQPTGIFLIPDQ